MWTHWGFLPFFSNLGGSSGMCTIGLISKSKSSTVTEISNRFIDEYMVEANGTYVKVYLYLLRHLNDHADFSVSEIAELLDCTQNFLYKALNYWEKEGLLEYSLSGNGMIEQINLVNLSEETTYTPRYTGSEEVRDVPQKNAVPAKKAPAKKTPAQKLDQSDLLDDEDVSFLLSTLEQYYQHPLSPEEMDTALFIHGDLGFSHDLTLLVFEHCIQKKKASAKYVRMVAMSWHDAGVTTEEEAENYILTTSEIYHTVCKEMGIDSSLGASQIKYIRSWVNDWHMPADVISLACSRTILSGKGANFIYANGILKSWHEAGVTSVADVEKLDAVHKEETKTKAKPAAKPAAAVKPNLFTDFEQREYSPEMMAELEKRMRTRKWD